MRGSDNMFDSKEIAKRSLQRATEIKEVRTRRRQFGVAIGATFCLCAMMLVAEQTLFSSVDEGDGTYIMISDPQTPLAPAPIFYRDFCPDCEIELDQEECPECGEDN